MSTAMQQSFNELEWHDAELKEVLIDRRQPGERDDVLLLIQWPDGRKQRLRFVECYGMMARMNFGIVATETFLKASCDPDAPALVELRERWLKMGTDLSRVVSFEMETNSTASLLQVFAERFELTDV
jgi:hypothetical protein